MVRNRKTGTDLVSLLFIMGLATLIGCDMGGNLSGVPPAGIDERSTLNETVVAPDDGVPEIGPANVGPPATKSITFSASPVFCCNPLTIEFDADLDDSDAATATIPQWEFGDGRTDSGRRVVHTYAWPGDFEVSMVVTMPNGMDAVTRKTLALSVNIDGATSVSLFEEASESKEGDLISVAGLGDFDDAELLIDAGPDVSVDPGETVILAGRVLQVSPGAELSFAWEQTGGPPVEIGPNQRALIQFQAPSMTSGVTTLEFLFSVFKDNVIESDLVTVEVLAPRDAESEVSSITAEDVVLSVGQDQTVEITLTAVAPPGQSISFEIVESPQSGTLGPVLSVPQSSARVSYTPETGFVGVDSFTFRATNGVVNSAPAEVTITVLQGNDRPRVIADAYLVVINESAPLTIRGDADSGVDLTFSVVSGPQHGSITSVNNVAGDLAVATYVPDADYEGVDSVVFEATDGLLVSLPETVTIDVRKRIIPWLELNAPDLAASDVATTEQGALPGMSFLDFCLVGLESWGQVTDTVIITTNTGRVGTLYPELMLRKPPHIKIIGGIKTLSIPGAVAGDERPYDFADEESWVLFAAKTEEIAQITGVPIVLFENETALERYHLGEVDIDLQDLADALQPVRQTGIETWWGLPRILGDTEAMPDRRVRTAAFVGSVANTLPTSRFPVNYAAWYGWREDGDKVQRQQDMADLVGPDRMQEGLFVTATGYFPPTNSGRPTYLPGQALDEMILLPGREVRIYPGAGNWIVVAQAFADALPELAR